MLFHLLSVTLDITLQALALVIILANIIFCIIIVFLERRNPQTALMWILLFLFIPILGFFIYLFFGRHLYKARLFKIKYFEDAEASEKAYKQLLNEYLTKNSTNLYGFETVAAFLTHADSSLLSDNNHVERFVDGDAKFAAFRETIESAKSYIHLEYFIIRDDELGRNIVELLGKKAREGVTVRAIFDAGGTFSIKKKKFFAPITDAGGDVRIFFPLKIPFLNTRVHFRDHRKILVVDGTTGMIGGFNIGDEYLGKGHLGYWRDTHLRIQGTGVADLQKRFLMDWNYTAKDAQVYFPDDETWYKYYPKEMYTEYHGESKVQIVSSGPDSPEKAIYYGYMNLINHAKKSIYIHSPYFVPDEPLMNAFRIAIRSGIDVRIVIPCKPDHPFIYWTNHSYLGDLIRLGARGYEYNDGFIHSKASIYDGKVLSVGTANWDIRSFKLNFETQAFVYDEKLATEMNEDFLKELETNCTEITLEDYNNRPLMMKIKEGICRLFSPLL